MTTPDILAAAERYGKHLAACEQQKPEESPYAVNVRGFTRFTGQKHADQAILARAYVEERKRPWNGPETQTDVGYFWVRYKPFARVNADDNQERVAIAYWNNTGWVAIPDSDVSFVRIGEVTGWRPIKEPHL